MESCYAGLSKEPRPRRLLCRRYAVVVFNSYSAYGAPCGGVRGTSFRWQLAVTSDGQCEVLGAGYGDDDVIEDLCLRGIEFIRLGVGDLAGAEPAFVRSFRHAELVPSVSQLLEGLVGAVPRRHRQAVAQGLLRCAEAVDLDAALSELASFQGTDLGERYPAVVQQWREALAGFKPIFALHPQLRGLVRSADLAAAEVRARLARAIRRHGPFADANAALDFIAASVERAERRLEDERAVALADLGAGARASPRCAAVGLPMLG